MKNILILFSFVLIVSCDTLESSDSDIDLNSTFLERFDGVGFEDIENDKGVFRYFFNDLNGFVTRVITSEGLGVNGHSEHTLCIKCTTYNEGENNYDDCIGRTQRFTITITENTYNKLVYSLDDYGLKARNSSDDSFVMFPNEGFLQIIEATDDDTIISTFTPYTKNWTGSLETDVNTLTRIDIEFSRIKCDKIQDLR